MGRARSFDETAVLDAATDRFWRHGYGATSVRDLGVAMGLGPASLYNAFGDKQALFARCLDHYLDANMRERMARLEPGRAALAAFLEETVTRSAKDPRGCLLVNSALEVAPHDPQIARVVADRLGELEAFFRRCVLAGQADGSICARRDADAMAALFITVVMGLRVLARGRPGRARLASAAGAALALLDPPETE